MGFIISITLTSPCDEHPSKPPLYIEKGSLQVYTLFFLFLLNTKIVGTH